MREAFALQKLLTNFSTKNIAIVEKLTFKILTCELTTSLVLNIQAQMIILKSFNSVYQCLRYRELIVHCSIICKIFEIIKEL